MLYQIDNLKFNVDIKTLKPKSLFKISYQMYLYYDDDRNV